MNSSTLAETFENFRKTVLAYEDNVVGMFNQRDDLLEINKIEEPLSEELKYLYRNYDIDIRFSYCNIGLCSFDFLPKLQKSYKYFSKDYGKTLELDNNWNKNWIVIADMNDDPIVADTGESGTPIYAAIEGVNYVKIAPSLEIFFKILTELLKTECEMNKIGPCEEENFEEYVAFYEKEITPCFLENVKNILDVEYLNNLQEFLFS